jgi:hypothetical protein
VYDLTNSTLTALSLAAFSPLARLSAPLI